MTKRTMTLVLFIGAASCSACSANESVTGGRTASADSGSGGDGGAGPAGATGAGGEEEASLGSTPGGDTSAKSCQYVDLLFLIDNSRSMKGPQEKLASSWPAFVDAMYEKLPADIDLHVGITTTSFYGGSCSESTSNCATTASQAEVAAHFVAPAAGDTGENGGQGRLFEYDGKRFFAANTSDADRTPLKTWFSGAATEAGEDGCSFEFSSAGVAYTTDPNNLANNGGFFRDEDGVLVVILLTDEPDKSFEGVAAYHDRLVSAKAKCGGDACILMAGLVDACVMETNQTAWQFMNAFGEPAIAGDIQGSADEYANVVGEALAQVVKTTCDEIAVPK